MFVDGIHPQLGHGKSNPPVVLPTLCGRGGGEVVAVVNDNGNTGQFQKICQRHNLGRQGTCGTGHGLRCVFLCKDETTAGFKSHDCLDIRILDGRQPTGTTSLGVREKDAWPYLGEQSGHGLCNHASVIGAGIGSDRAQELVQRLR
ncbi:hypothetical protein D3C72_1882920 [compost metagenome]